MLYLGTLHVLAENNDCIPIQVLNNCNLFTAHLIITLELLKFIRKTVEDSQLTGVR